MRTNSTILLAVLVILLTMFTGCSEESSNVAETSTFGTDNYDSMDFSLPYGGLTVSDEYEAFDDGSLQAMLDAEDDGEVEGEYAADPEIQALEAAGEEPGNPDDPDRPRFTFLRLRWGLIRGPADTLNVPEPPCDITEWSGLIHLDRGILQAQRLIRFEAHDHLVRPSLDRQTVALVSHTACGHDGLLLKIIERPGDFDPEHEEPNRLHINLGPYSAVFEVEALAGLQELVEIGDNGNLVKLTGFNLSDVSYCPKGFLSGRFRHIPDEEVVVDEESGGTQIGRMAGTYTDLAGRITGFMRGGYGLDADGNRVFFCKYIDRRGHFRGLMRGTWEPGDEERDMTSFTGHWVSRSGNREGLLNGVAHPVQDIPGGFYEGRWTTICDDQAEEQIR